MFEDLRAAFREAIENFNAELRRDRVPETVDRLLRGMSGELAEAKVLVSELEREVEKARSQADAERVEATTCRRREQMARGIGDTETADLALRFAERHESRHRLFEQKAVALSEELAFRRRDVEEMFAALKEARDRRDSLSATSGRSGARESLGAADDLFRELDRMAEKIEGEHAQGEAAASMDPIELDDGLGSEFRIDLDEPPHREELDLDAALDELKRRMGRDQ